jgi:hypothetical protein
MASALDFSSGGSLVAARIAAQPPRIGVGESIQDRLKKPDGTSRSISLYGLFDEQGTESGPFPATNFISDGSKLLISMPSVDTQTSTADHLPTLIRSVDRLVKENSIFITLVSTNNQYTLHKWVRNVIQLIPQNERGRGQCVDLPDVDGDLVMRWGRLSTSQVKRA